MWKNDGYKDMVDTVTFLACPGYPECKNAKPIVEELDVPCPKCGGKILAEKKQKG